MQMPNPVMSIAELRTFIAKEFPQSVDDFPDLEVTRVDAGRVDLRMRALTRHLRPGGTVSGPTLFGLVDLAGYFCVLTHIGPEALSVTTNLNINFMRKADPGLLDVEARILKLGKRLMVFDASVTQSDADNIIAHATGTYAIPPRKQEG